MAQIATIRRKNVSIPTDNGEGEIVFAIKGLSGAATMDYWHKAKAMEFQGAYESVIDNGVVAVVSGLVTDDGKETLFDIKRHGSVAPFLNTAQINKLADEILIHSQLTPEQKKD